MRVCPAGNGKGACACRLSGFQHPALAVAPSGHRRDERLETIFAAPLRGDWQ